MTEENGPEKPGTPGMAEVSAKFVHEAEAAVAAAASTDETLSALWQEHERLRAQYSEAGRETDLAFTAEKAITETETPEYRIAAAAHEAADQHQQETSDAIVATHNRMAKMPARTVAGALSKLRVIGVDIADEFKGHDGVLDETLLGSTERLTLSALADLERLAGTAAPQDTRLETLAANYYATYIARDAATAAREDAWGKAMELDREATRIEIGPFVTRSLELGSVFEDVGTLTPTREQVFEYARHREGDRTKFTEAVMQHLAEYGERCVAAFEAAGWPENHAEIERAEQRMEAAFDHGRKPVFDRTEESVPSVAAMEKVKSTFKAVKDPLWNPYYRGGYTPRPIRKAFRAVFKRSVHKPKGMT